MQPQAYEVASLNEKSNIHENKRPETDQEKYQRPQGSGVWGFSLLFWDTVLRWAMFISLVAGGITATVGFVSGWVGYSLPKSPRKTRHPDRGRAERYHRSP
jgi:hypothetical protein